MSYDYEYGLLKQEPPKEDYYSQREAKEALLREIVNVANERLANRQSQQTQDGEPARTWSYYENMRKTDKAKYVDSKTQAQMFKDRMDLGEAFEDGTFDKRAGVYGWN